jgi:negative regulator of flagellin synthesis FlgM
MKNINFNGMSNLDRLANQKPAADVNQKPATEQSTNQVAPPQTDRVKVSDAATKVDSLKARVSEMPDVRQGRVEELRTLVESGDYKPEAGKIADAILKEEQ